MGQTFQGCEDSLVEPFSPQIFSRDRSILDHVMEERHDLRLYIFHGVHEPEWVEDIRLAVLVLLHLMGLGGYPQRFLDGWYDSLRFEVRSDSKRFGLIISLHRL